MRIGLFRKCALMVGRVGPPGPTDGRLDYSIGPWAGRAVPPYQISHWVGGDRLGRPMAGFIVQSGNGGRAASRPTDIPLGRVGPPGPPYGRLDCSIGPWRAAPSRPTDISLVESDRLGRPMAGFIVQSGHGGPRRPALPT